MVKSDAREGYLGYVVRLHHPDGRVLGFACSNIKEPPAFASVYQKRCVYDNMIEATEVEKKYNSVKAGYFARIVPNGGKEYCETVESFTYTWYCG